MSDSRPRSPSVSMTSTLVETDDEEGGVDGQGFSKKDYRKAVAESRQAAIARPFYGASTSNLGDQPLSREEWDRLGQFTAVPSSPLSPPDLDPSPLTEAPPGKAKRLLRLKKIIKKIIRNPFKSRGRIDVAP
ncbi:hypothetical protein FS837_003888 [Tulasnella sp. UAMH 9824]|nr:hypothetical protein FS837_003888 [Tulasnella sp. UAMH 9824]